MTNLRRIIRNISNVIIKNDFDNHVCVNKYNWCKCTSKEDCNNFKKNNYTLYLIIGYCVGGIIPIVLHKIAHNAKQRESERQYYR